MDPVTQMQSPGSANSRARASASATVQATWGVPCHSSQVECASALAHSARCIMACVRITRCATGAISAAASTISLSADIPKTSTSRR